MCGYLIFPKKVSKKDVDIFLTAQKHRGVDGYGCILVDGDKKHKYCKHLDKPSFLNSYAKLPHGGAIIHHRKASIGGINSTLVHPLTDEDKSVLIMQNGTRKALVSIFNGASDTKVIADLWHHVSDDVLYQILDGTGVVFAADTDGLWFHRDSGRTLYHCKEGKWAGMYASEPLAAGKWALVDEYLLQRLPLDINNWDLQCGEAVEYKMQECNVYHCKDMFLYSGKDLCCPSCRIRPKYGRGAHNYGYNGNKNNNKKNKSFPAGKAKSLPLPKLERTVAKVDGLTEAERNKVVKTVVHKGVEVVTYGDGRITTIYDGWGGH